MSSLRRLSAIFLLSVSLVALELVWTRLFSAEFFYPFAFLTLSLAIMGLGLGALAVRLFPWMLQESRLGWMLSLAACAALAGPPLVFRMGIDFESLFGNPAMIARFVGVVALLTGAFFFGGMALAVFFRMNAAEMSRLYMADLVGAGAGVFVAVLLMNTIGTQLAVFLCSAPVIAAALLALTGLRKLVPALLAVAMTILGLEVAPLLEMKREERGPVIFKHWDAMAKLKLYGFGQEYRSFNIDNLANTGTHGFDGNWNRSDRKPFEFLLDVSYLVRRFDQCRFLSLGAGGGSDVLQALQAGAAEIHAVEVNPQINRMLLRDDLRGYVIPSPEQEWLDAEWAKEQPAPGQTKSPKPPRLPDRVIGMDEFSGRIYRDPRVRVATEDARAYIRSLEPGSIDIIFSLSSNTFAALASGSFAMAENYLFTEEAFRDYWRALGADGFLVMEHQFYMPRLVASVQEMLRGAGVQDAARHFAVYDLPEARRNVLLLSKRPLTETIIHNALGPLSDETTRLLHPPAPGAENELVSRIVREGWRSVAADAPINVSPTTDNRPFVGQMGLWRNLDKPAGEETPRQKRLKAMEVFGYPMSKVLLVTILAVIGVLILPLNILPALRKGPRLGAGAWSYFFLIGLAFMAVEVVLIQKYTLLVGPNAYSIAAILATLLTASGMGSLISPRFGERFPFLAIVTWLVLDVTVFPHLVEALAPLSLSWRIAATALLIAPLGFFMGMPFPKAALRVGDLVDWGFAINGAASVLGATAVLLIAFEYGFSTALMGSAVLYAAAGALLNVRVAWRTAGAVGPAPGVEAPPSQPAMLLP